MSFRSFIVERAIKKLGADLKDARKRRRIKTAIMAERLGVTRATLDRMEKGSMTVSMGTYATALYTLDASKLDELAGIFSHEKDILGQTIEDRDLPKRIRGSARK